MSDRMLFRFILVGRMKDPALKAKAEEYLTRLSGRAKCEVVELKDSRRDAECHEIMRRLSSCGRERVIVLSEDGEEISSMELAKRLAAVDTRVNFVVGGADGLTEEVKSASGMVWSLSRLTFPHEVARMLLFEQLFRALDINSGGKYHRP